MAHKVNISDLIDYKKNIILTQSTEKPHKSIVLHLAVSNQLVGGLRLEKSIRVLDQLGKIRYTGDFLEQAVQTYNKLYNE